MTDDETISAVLLRANKCGHLDVADVNILCGRISQLKASNEMAAEHMARGREWAFKLEGELDALKAAVRKHRDQKADDRCIEDDDRLYEALGDGIKCDRRVGSKEEMLANCARYIQMRCERGHWQSYSDLEAERNRLLNALLEIAKLSASAVKR